MAQCASMLPSEQVTGFVRRTWTPPACQALISRRREGIDCTRTFGLMCDGLSRSLMESAGWCPIALAHFTCQPNSGLHQPRSYLLRHHCMIACAIGGISNLVLPLLCTDPITLRRNRIGNSCRMPTVPTRSGHSCLLARPLRYSCCVVPAVCLTSPAHWPCVRVAE
jgi:hypothetical protein